jgi:hypothetical protein
VRRKVYITCVQRVTEKFVKKLLGKGNGKIQAALERLDRLTKDEGLSSVVQTLGEINEMKRLSFLSLSSPRPTIFCR